MQDKNYKRLAKQGWKDMETLLDSEMPVKRRRYMVPLLLLLGIIGLGGWWLMNLEHSAKRSEEIAIDHSQIESTENKSDRLDQGIKEPLKKEFNDTEAFLAKNKNEHVLKQKASVKNKNKELVSNNVSSAPINTKLNDQLLAEKRTDEKKINKEGSLGNMDVVGDETLSNLDQNESNSKEFSKTEVAKHVSAIDEEKIGSERVRLPIMVTLLDKPALSRVNDSRENDAINIHLIPEKYKYKPDTDVILEAGALFSSFNTNRGVYAGMGIEYYLGRRWSLQTGVKYIRFSSKGILRNIGLANNFELFNEQTDPASDPGGFVPEIENDMDTKVSGEVFKAVNQSINRISMLSVPLVVNYKLTRKQSLGLGASYHYTLGAQSDEGSLRDGNRGLESSLGSFQYNEAVIFTMNRHLFSFQTKYRYELMKNLGLNAGFNLGLNEIIHTTESQGVKNTATYLSLGIDYRL
ncbi:outer membrane beta-barrel protein [Portibacter marinus]|uniref:outer membrane beta-barrel protein n=1 Tax=Portibacter marinus TaxID=2898660 RepID=UPI001F346B08|nr:outer membrane beta-barrel protein [Portibacter marinus]